MSPSIQDTSDGERERVAGVWRGYAGSAAKRRAWGTDKPGNAAARAELIAVLERVADDAIGGDGDVLDVGCGVGWWLRRLAASGVDPARLHGIDIQEDRLGPVRRHLPGASFRAADARRLPYEDGRFALVTYFTVLSSLAESADVHAALREGWRVLRPGGLLVVYDPLVPTLNRATRRVSRREVAAAVGCPPEAVVPLTVLPPLMRRLGQAGERAYPALRRVRPLLTHRVQAHRRAS